MHPPRRGEVVLHRREHRPEPHLPHPRQDDLRPPRQLEGGHDPPGISSTLPPWPAWRGE